MKINTINTPVSDFTTVNVEERKALDVRAGDTVKVTIKIKETGSKGKEKVRLQIFEGLVISRKHGNEAGATMTVRRVSKGYGVERIFPMYSPIIDRIEIVKKGGVRKSKLYYLREKVAKEIKRQMRRATLVNISTTSDIEENERKIKEAEDVKKTESEKVEAETKIQKDIEDKIKFEKEAENNKEDTVVVEEKTEIKSEDIQDKESEIGEAEQKE